MTQTTNFNLNIVEGTDNVNLLTQMNPNTEAIDVQMKTNEDHGIQEATELFTSTVHAITRLKPDAKVFRFTAVSNYTAGETFTVDGVQVTALLTSGEALTTGSFIIGSEVICALRDTLLTVFVNAGTASIAKNAEKLGGELPSYYGTAEDVATAVDNAGTALETANAVSGAVGNVSALTTTDKSSCVAAINEVNSNLTFPNGEGFYPDEKDGVKGYNTSPERGADTFVPFSSLFSGNYESGSVTPKTSGAIQTITVEHIPKAILITSMTSSNAVATILFPNIPELCYRIAIKEANMTVKDVGGTISITFESVSEDKLTYKVTPYTTNTICWVSFY